LIRLLAIMFAAVCMISAISIIRVQHQIRTTFTELQNAHQVRDELNLKWRRLLVEKEAFSSRVYLKSWAQSDLQMRSPDEFYLIAVSTDRSRREGLGK